MTETFVKKFNNDQFSIRIGQKVPKDDVNIAYIDTPPLNSDENVQVADLSANIQENYWGDRKQEEIMYPNIDNKLHYKDFTSSTLPTNNFIITDKYLDGQKEIPLFYQYQTIYQHYAPSSDPEGTIKVVDNQGNTVDENRYRIITTESDNNPDCYRVKLELNFTSDVDQTYFVEYQAIINNISNKKEGFQEVINAEPIFKETTKEKVLDNNNKDKPIFAVELDTSTNGYQIYVPVAADTQEDKEWHNKKLEADIGIPFEYQVEVEGFKQSESEGVAVMFVVDKSASMQEIPEEELYTTVQYFMDEVGEDRCKFNITLFNDDIDILWPNNFVDGATILSGDKLSSRQPGGKTAFFRAVKEGLINMNKNKDALENHKKVLIALTDGKDNASGSFFENLFGTKDGEDTIEYREEVGLDVEVWGIGIDGADETQVKSILDDDSYYRDGDDYNNLQEIYNDIAEEAKPVHFKESIMTGSNVIDKQGSPKKLRQLLLNVSDNIMVSTVNISLKNSSDYAATYFYNEKTESPIGDSLDGESHSNLNAEDILEFNEENGEWVFKEENSRIYIYASTNYKPTIYTRQYNIKLNQYKGIYARMPVNRDIFENWYPEIHNGRFRIEKQIDDKLVSSFYHLPEFDRQLELYDGDNIFKVDQEIPEILDEKTLKLSSTPLYVETDFDNNDIRIITNIVVTELSGVTDKNRTIKVDDYNSESGELYLEDRIDPRKDIRVDYYYTNEWLTYKGYYDKTKNKFVHLDLNPFRGHTYSKKKDNKNTYNLNPTHELFNKTVYLYIRPAEKMEKKLDEPNYRIIYGSRKADTLFHTVGKKADSSHPMYSEDVKLLAKINVQPNSTRNDITIIDTRQRGGGLKESISQDIIDKINPEADYYWDIGYLDGKAYPGNSTVVIKLPKKILKEYGGRFEKSEVEKIVDRHIAYGSYFIVEYVDPEDYLNDYEL